MNIGLVDVDSHNFPNLALMKISSYHKQRGDLVELWNGLKHYDRVYQSKVFDDTYSQDNYFCNAGAITNSFSRRLNDSKITTRRNKSMITIFDERCCNAVTLKRLEAGDCFVVLGTLYRRSYEQTGGDDIDCEYMYSGHKTMFHKNTLVVPVDVTISYTETVEDYK